ncbi:hypothetical protein ACTXT7_001401 [Hymenolepis weldensis]
MTSFGKNRINGSAPVRSKPRKTLDDVMLLRRVNTAYEALKTKKDVPSKVVEVAANISKMDFEFQFLLRRLILKHHYDITFEFSPISAHVLSAELLEYSTSEKLAIFISHTLNYQLLNSYAHTWICKTICAGAVAAIIG